MSDSDDRDVKLVFRDPFSERIKHLRDGAERLQREAQGRAASARLLRNILGWLSVGSAAAAALTAGLELPALIPAGSAALSAVASTMRTLQKDDGVAKNLAHASRCDRLLRRLRKTDDEYAGYDTPKDMRLRLEGEVDRVEMEYDELSEEAATLA